MVKETHLFVKSCLPNEFLCAWLLELDIAESPSFHKKKSHLVVSDISGHL